MVCRWEAVPPLCLLFRLALGDDDRTERFGCMQPGTHVGTDVRETQVVFWGRHGRLWEVYVCPSLEPDAHAISGILGQGGGANALTLRNFFKGVVQEVLLFDLETWAVNPA